MPRPGSAPTLAMALLLGTLSTVSPLSIDTFFPSIPAIAADFQLSAWQVQQIITSYMLPYALFTLVHGPLSDALGRRNLVVLGMLLYTAASAGCAFAPSFGALLVCRVLQGIAAGIGPTIARAVVLNPKFIVLDEPTSALDMSVQAQIVDLLRDLQRRRNLAYLFISHDLKVVKALANHVIVMREGHVVEEGPAEVLFASPQSDYTKALFAAAFHRDGTQGAN